ncbi:hypothetical protein [Streptomyces fulvoviolaceus]|uniref:hypothetical protein n=1 Tax=Streptomyces fulvoviolaceus TaxID=285535 RepID=UPI0004CB0D80|nr:hypothetical protein [Streptomyces fulvoviolaceus]MCT9080006.1 hypothetical protein [Streptomyces fulvoviolaceus]
MQITGDAARLDARERAACLTELPTVCARCPGGHRGIERGTMKSAACFVSGGPVDNGLSIPQVRNALERHAGSCHGALQRRKGRPSVQGLRYSSLTPRRASLERPRDPAARDVAKAAEAVQARFTEIHDNLLGLVAAGAAGTR